MSIGNNIFLVDDYLMVVIVIKMVLLKLILVNEVKVVVS